MNSARSAASRSDAGRIGRIRALEFPRLSPSRLRKNSRTFSAMLALERFVTVTAADDEARCARGFLGTISRTGTCTRGMTLERRSRGSIRARGIGPLSHAGAGRCYCRDRFIDSKRPRGEECPVLSSTARCDSRTDTCATRTSLIFVPDRPERGLDRSSECRHWSTPYVSATSFTAIQYSSP